MKFQVNFEIIAADREELEQVLSQIAGAYQVSDCSIQSRGPDRSADCYTPELTSKQRDQGWCIQLDGEDQVMGIPRMEFADEYKLRGDAVRKISDASNVEEHQEALKIFFKLIVQLCLGDYNYFDNPGTVEKMRAMVSFSFAHPQAILPPDARESFLASEYSMPGIRDLLGGAPPKDQMN